MWKSSQYLNIKNICKDKVQKLWVNVTCSGGGGFRVSVSGGPGPCWWGRCRRDETGLVAWGFGLDGPQPPARGKSLKQFMSRVGGVGHELSCSEVILTLISHLSLSSPACLSLTCLSLTCLSPSMSEDSVGLRRILSQSTESLNFRSRTLSMESLTDDGLLISLWLINNPFSPLITLFILLLLFMILLLILLENILLSVWFEFIFRGRSRFWIHYIKVIWACVCVCVVCILCCGLCVCVCVCACCGAGEWWWSPLLEELQVEGSCVQADSWSLVVEPNFLQTLHKDLIKQQDVIYGI